MKIRRIVRRPMLLEVKETKVEENNNIPFEEVVNEKSETGNHQETLQSDGSFFDNITMLSGSTPWRTTATGHTIKLKIKSNDLIHPFKGIKKGSRLRVEVSSERFGIFFEGECLLITWHDDPTNGETVQFKLDTVGGQHPFEVIESSDVMHMKVWLIADDEKVIKVKQKFSDKSPLKQSVIMSKFNQDFHQFCYTNRDFLSTSGDYLSLENPEVSEDFATRTVKAFCHIESRSELGDDTFKGLVARRKWSVLLDTFNRWRS